MSNKQLDEIYEIIRKPDTPEFLAKKLEALKNIDIEEIQRSFKNTLQPDKETTSFTFKERQGGIDDLGMGKDGSAPVAVFSEAEAKNHKNAVLITEQLKPRQLSAFEDIEGIVSLKPFFRPHFRLIAKNKDIPMLIANDALHIKDNSLVDGNGNVLLKSGDPVSIGGNNLFLGAEKVEISPLRTNPEKLKLDKVLEFAKEANQTLIHNKDMRGFPIEANASNSAGVKRAIKGGFDGVGLYRTEHMYLEHAPMDFQVAIIAGNDPSLNDKKEKALENLKNVHEAEFTKIFSEDKIKEGKFPITMRLADIVPFESLPDPKEPEAIKNVADRLGKSEEWVKEKVENLLNREGNICNRTLEEHCTGFIKMQLEATAEAMSMVGKGAASNISLKIPLPETESAKDIEFLVATADKAFGSKELANFPDGKERAYIPTALIETNEGKNKMEEIVVAAAKYDGEVRIGTNDMTQAITGISRKDNKRIAEYVKENGFNPFEILDKRVEAFIEELLRECHKNGVNLGTPSAQASHIKGGVPYLELTNNIPTSKTEENFPIAGSPTEDTYMTMTLTAGKVAAEKILEMGIGIFKDKEQATSRA